MNQHWALAIGILWHMQTIIKTQAKNISDPKVNRGREAVKTGEVVNSPTEVHNKSTCKRNAFGKSNTFRKKAFWKPLNRCKKSHIVFRYRKISLLIFQLKNFLLYKNTVILHHIQDL